LTITRFLYFNKYMARISTLSNSEQNEVVIKFQGGKKVTSIAEEYKVGTGTIYLILERFVDNGGEFTAGIKIGQKRRPKPEPKQFRYLKSIVPKSSPLECGIKQKKSDRGWTEYEIQTLLLREFNTKHTLKDCFQLLLKLNVAIGCHSVDPSISTQEKLLRQPSNDFTEWLSEKGYTQQRHEKKVLNSLNKNGQFHKPVSYRITKNSPSPWKDLFQNLILRDPLNRDPENISKKLLKIIITSAN